MRPASGCARHRVGTVAGAGDVVVMSAATLRGIGDLGQPLRRPAFARRPTHCVLKSGVLMRMRCLGIRPVTSTRMRMERHLARRERDVLRAPVLPAARAARPSDTRSVMLGTLKMLTPLPAPKVVPMTAKSAASPVRLARPPGRMKNGVALGVSPTGQALPGAHIQGSQQLPVSPGEYAGLCRGLLDRRGAWRRLAQGPSILRICDAAPAATCEMLASCRAHDSRFPASVAMNVSIAHRASSSRICRGGLFI